MVYTRKSKLFKLPGADIIALTNHLDVCPDTRGWKRAIDYMSLNISEARRCEMGGGAGPFVELLCQRGWNIGKTMDMLTEIGNQAAVTSLGLLLADDNPPVEVKLIIKGDHEIKTGGQLKLTIHAPSTYTDVQWYFEKTCLRAEKSRVLQIDKVSDSGRYKARLEAGPHDVKWVFADVTVGLPGSSANTTELKFILQPQDFVIKQDCSEAHFFVDLQPYSAALQWYSDGLIIHGATQPYLVVPNLNQNAHRRQFKCTATLDHITVTSNVALIRWIPDGDSELSGHTFAETATDKVALVIGNQTYQEPSFVDIVHAEDDARDVSQCLKQLQFKVVSLINLNKDEMITACENFYKLLSSGVYGVFYFAGHGFEFSGDNYLIPVDAPGNVRVEHCLKAQFVLHRMQFRETKLNLLLLDMCRDQFSNVGVPHDMQPVRSFGNTAIGFACGSGFRAYGSENDKNGIYVKYLKDHITRNVTVTNLLDSVNKAIGLREPNINQRPHYQSSIIKNISLCDPIDTTDHTAEFNHRSTIWSMANNVDKSLEEFLVNNVKVRLDYTAAFSNVLMFTLTSELELDNVFMDQDSTANGLVLVKLSEVGYEIRNIQKLLGPVIELRLCFKRLKDLVEVKISRPLFAKIIVNRMNFGAIMNVDMSGTHMTGLCQVPSGAKQRGPPRVPPRGGSEHVVDCHVSEKEKARATKKEKDLEEYYAEKDKVKGDDNDVGDDVKNDADAMFHVPVPLEDRDNEYLVYPFVGVYLYPQSTAKGDDVNEIVSKIRREGEGREEEARVSMTTHIVRQQSSIWIEIVLTEQQEATSKSMYDGTSWHGSNSVYSPRMVAMLDMVRVLSVSNDISEMWITDHNKYRQILPVGSDLIIDVNPVTLPVA